MCKNFSRTNKDKEEIKRVLEDISNCKKILLILKRDECVLRRNLKTVCGGLQQNSFKNFDPVEDFSKFESVEKLDNEDITLHADYSQAADNVEEEYID